MKDEVGKGPVRRKAGDVKRRPGGGRGARLVTLRARYQITSDFLYCFCFYSLYLPTVPTLLSPQGAGRIQSLRAFRRAG